MKYYYNKFLQYSFDKIKPENEEQYLFILWVCNEYINESGKLSDKIKDELSEGTFRSDLNKIKYLLSLKIQKQNEQNGKRDTSRFSHEGDDEGRRNGRETLV